MLVSGEAGIGKTRLVEELKSIAAARGCLVLSGSSLYESLTPYMPFVEALRSGGLEHLFGEENPRVEGVYLVADNGLLVKSVVREETRLDPDIFASMLSTVAGFVKDSLTMIAKTAKRDTLTRLDFGGHSILLERGTGVNLVAILSGRENEFLIGDLRGRLAEMTSRYGPALTAWEGDDECTRDVARFMEPLIAKYDGVAYGLEDPRSRRNLLFENVSLGLRRGTQSRPILLCIEDLQWADPSTLALIHYVARATRDAAVLVVGSYRPEELVSPEGQPHHLAETMQRMQREDLLEGIELHRLTESEATRIVAGFVGGDLPTDFVHRLHEETEGNPFVLIELLKLLVQENVLTETEGRLTVGPLADEVEIPSRVHLLILRRLDRVAKEEREVLEVASVIGDVFPSDTLASVLRRERLDVLRSLQTLEQKHRLIRTYDGRFRFDHVKVQEVLYAELPEELRMEYHGAVADAMAQKHAGSLPQIAGDLAFHRLRSRDKESALQHLLVAAERAEKQYANVEALRFIGEALALLESRPPVDERLRLLWRRAELLRVTGENLSSRETARLLLAAAQEAHNPEFEAKADIVLGSIGFRTGEFPAALEDLRHAHHAAEAAGDEPLAMDAVNEMGYVHERMGDLEAAGGCFKAVLAFGLTKGDAAVVSKAYRAMGVVRERGGRYGDAKCYYESALASAEKAGDLRQVARICHDLAVLYTRTDEGNRALEMSLRCIELSKKTHDGRAAAYASVVAGGRLAERGDFRESEDRLLEALTTFTHLGESAMVAAAHRELGNLRGLEERYPEAIEEMEKALDIYAKEVTAPYYRGYTLHRMGRIRAKTGDVGGALRDMRDALDVYIKAGSETEVRELREEIAGLEAGRRESAADRP